MQYVEDFKFWVMTAGNSHRLPEKEIVKMCVNSLKPEIFREDSKDVRADDPILENMGAIARLILGCLSVKMRKYQVL